MLCHVMSCHVIQGNVLNVCMFVCLSVCVFVCNKCMYVCLSVCNVMQRNVMQCNVT